MAAESANGANGHANGNGQPSPATEGTVRLIVADSQAIFRVGVRKVFAMEDDVRLIGQAETLDETLMTVVKFPADVLLIESRLVPNPAEGLSLVLKAAPDLKVIVITESLEESMTVDYLRRGVKGIITPSIAPELLVRCVKKVAQGETWLDNQGVNWVIEAYRTQTAALFSPKPKNRLTEKELLIVSCVAQGMKNKDIAREIGTTGQVIKNYLRRVYDKLGVSDRLELALYCVHHRLLESSPKMPAGSEGPEQKADEIPDVSTITH